MRRKFCSNRILRSPLHEAIFTEEHSGWAGGKRGSAGFGKIPLLQRPLSVCPSPSVVNSGYCFKISPCIFSKIIRTYILMKGSLSYSSICSPTGLSLCAYLWFCWAQAERNLQMNKGKEDFDFWKDCHKMLFVMITYCFYDSYPLNFCQVNTPQSSRESLPPPFSMLLLEMVTFLGFKWGPGDSGLFMESIIFSWVIQKFASGYATQPR